MAVEDTGETFQEEPLFSVLVGSLELGFSRPQVLKAEQPATPRSQQPPFSHSTAECLSGLAPIDSFPRTRENSSKYWKAGFCTFH